ncbi:MAG: hypothetical protein QF831_01615 [Candidatus Thalassarchaeaceae archaeon]|nr:hypothetical protein [Candidatus Thalassarchaeaceae archaeon]
MRKISMFIISLLTISLFSIPQEIELESHIENKFANPLGSVQMVVLSDNGSDIFGAEVNFIDAWTDLSIGGPFIMSESMEVLSNLSIGPARVVVTHLNYTSGGAIANISDGEIPVEVQISLTPLDSTLNLNGPPLATVSLTLLGDLKELETTLNASGNNTLSVPDSGEGWIVSSSGTNKSLTHWDGEENLSLQNNGTMLVSGLSADANESGTLRIEHHPSGYWELMEWNGAVNVNLPRTSEGEWHFFNIDNGLRIGPPLIANDAPEVNISTLLNNQSVWPTPEWGGHGYLNMTETPEIGQAFNVSWEANYDIPMDFGTALFPERSRGLTQQVDFNHDGAINGMELTGLLEIQASHPWADSEHLFLFDETPLTGKVERQNFAVTQNNVIGAGYYSWSESATLSGQATFGSSRMFWFPVRGDAIEAIPITVNLPSGWEVRYSPQIELITGGSTSFTLNRSLSPTVGMWTVTIGPNQAPVANAHLEDRFGLVIPLDRNSTIVSDCTDSGVAALNNRWEYRRNGYYHGSGDNASHTFKPDDFNFYHGDIFNATLVCSDWEGAMSKWWGEFYVDGQAPSATLNASEVPIVDFPPLYYNLEDGAEFAVRAGSMITVIAEPSDDSGAVVQVIWRSNKSEGWQHHDYRFEDQFNQGNDVNWMHMAVEDRYQQRELTVYSLEMELIDGAGNSNISRWNVTILDATPPTITAEVMVDDLPIGPLNPALPESEISLNLSRSFDDIDAIENIVWSVILDNQSVIENGTWEDARLISLPSLDVGIHELRIFAQDSAGNTREVITNPIVEPQIAADVSGVEINVEGDSIIGEPGTILVKLQNIGSTDSNLTICYHEQCVDSFYSGVATSQGPAIKTFPLEVSEFENGRISVEVEWYDQVTGEGGDFTMNSEIIPQSQWGDDADIIVVGGFAILAYLIIRNRRKEGSTPF